MPPRRARQGAVRDAAMDDAYRRDKIAQLREQVEMLTQQFGGLLQQPHQPVNQQRFDDDVENLFAPMVNDTVKLGRGRAINPDTNRRWDQGFKVDIPEFHGDPIYDDAEDLDPEDADLEFDGDPIYDDAEDRNPEDADLEFDGDPIYDDAEDPNPDDADLEFDGDLIYYNVEDPNPEDADFKFDGDLIYEDAEDLDPEDADLEFVTGDTCQSLVSTCTIGGKVCKYVIDSESCKNIVAEEVVTKLSLTPERHLQPYKLSWLQTRTNATISQQALISFFIRSICNDQVLCDMVGMDVCHLLLGRPWQYDYRTSYDGHLQLYVRRKEDRTHVIEPD